MVALTLRIDSIGPGGVSLAKSLPKHVFAGWLGDVPSGGAMAESDLLVDLHVERIRQLIQVNGSFRADITFECSRCLDQQQQTINGTVRAVMRPALDEEEEESEDDDMDLFHYEGSEIDLADVVREVVLLALPTYPLCSPDCPGLCSTCGARLADGDCGCKKPIDPRWAALENLRLAEE